VEWIKYEAKYACLFRKDDIMELAKIDVAPRSKEAKANALRRKGYVPGILYGIDQENRPIVFDKTNLTTVIQKYGENALLEISLEDEIKPVVIKEVQRDPVTHEIAHIDLQTVQKNRKIHTSVPVMVKGLGIVERKGGIVQHQLDRIEIEGYSTDIPKYVTVDVSNLYPGQKLQVGDLEISEELSILTPKQEVVVTVLSGEKQRDTTVEETKQETVDENTVSKEEVE